MHKDLAVTSHVILPPRVNLFLPAPPLLSVGSERMRSETSVSALRSQSFRKSVKGRGFLRTPHRRESCSSVLVVLREGHCCSHRSPWFTVLPAPFRSSGLWENLGTRSRKDFSGWRCWGEKRGGAEGVPCRGMRGLPRVGALGAVWHSVQQVAPESIDLRDPREPERGSFLGDGQPF